MVDVIKVASYISQRYEYQFGSRIEEIKLQVLLYFIQRECIVQAGMPLFEDVFTVVDGILFIPSVHIAYMSDALHTKLPEDTLEKYLSVFDHVFKSYAAKDMIGLTTLIQSEYSWRKAQKEITSTKVVQNGDISKDAERIRNRRFLLKHLQDFRKPVYA